MKSPDASPSILRPFLIAGAFLFAFLALGGSLLQGYALGLGSTNAPTPPFGRFLAVWMLFGSAAAAAGAVALARYAARRPSWREDLRAAPDAKWMLYGSLFAGLLPASLHTWLLFGQPLIDDERAYRFAAEILATGRLWADSPPMKLFFDNPFLINDGKLFTQYFLGWPALMAPGVWFGVADFMNSVYAALAAPAIYLVGRRIGGTNVARAALVLYVTSPMLLIGSAGATSHPTCLGALAWTLYFALRSRDDDASLAVHAAVGLLFSVAFFIRPTTALGFGTPLLLYHLGGLRRLDKGRAVRALAAFAVPAVVLAGCFLAVNQAQNGSPTAVSYDAYYEYSKSNQFRFSIWPGEVEVTVRNYYFDDPIKAIAINSAALLRLNAALFGWPFSLLFIAFARGPAARLLGWCVFSFGIVHFFTNSVGVDTYAPMHFYELALPAILLTALGLQTLDRFVRRFNVSPTLNGIVPALAASLIVAAWLGYVPVRFGTLHELSEAIAQPSIALREAGIERGVIFAPDPFIDTCAFQPSLAFLFSRPNNDPALQNDILWVNHLTVELDRRLMREHFPDRGGWILVWDERCSVRLIPLDQARTGMVPEAPAGMVLDVR